MKTKTLLVLSTIFALLFFGCKKELVEPLVNSPNIIEIHATPKNVTKGGTTSILCIAVDPEQNPLTHTWTAPAGTFYTDTTFLDQSNVGNPIIWKAPDNFGVFLIEVVVEDGTGGADSGAISIPVGRYRLLETIGEGVLSQPMGVYVQESSGKVFVTDAGDDNVWEYDGVNWTDFSYRGEVDTSIDTTIIIEPPETTVVIDTTLDTLGFDMPTDIFIDGGGITYVLDGGLDRIHRFNSLSYAGYDTSFSSISGAVGYPPTGFIVEGGYAYAACGRQGIRIIDLSLGSAVRHNVNGARDIIYNGTDRWWVSVNESDNRYFVNEYDLSFNLLNTIQDSVYQPWGIALAPSGNIFVSQWGDISDTLANPQCHIAEFTTAGGFVGRWGDTGGGEGQFNSPAGLWITSDHKIYVCDRGNGVVKVFGPN